MCGIVGLLAPYNKDRFAMFEDMLHVDTVRGVDSTGVAFINNKRVDVVKDIVLPGELMYTKEYIKAASKQRFCLIGHNRAATKGLVTRSNAHPFTVDHITLVHNGTLNTTWQMPDDKKFQTDSECITNAIAKHGVKVAWPCINGAATLAWWDAKEKTFNIISNGKRPMHFLPLEDYNGMAFASEKWMIIAAAYRNGVKLTEVDKNYTPDDDTHYKFWMNHKQNKFEWEKEKLSAWAYGNMMPGAVDPYPTIGYKPANSTYSHWQYHNKHSGSNFFQQLQKSGATSDLKSDEELMIEMRQKYPEAFEDEGEEELSNVVPFDGGRRVASNTNAGNIDTFDPKTMNKKSFTLEWFMSVYHKCTSCLGFFTKDDYETAMILDDHSAVCETCQRTALMNGIHPSRISYN
jgi:predicted glutamine amidotransferase